MAAQTDTLGRFEFRERHMGVVSRVVLYASSEAAARDAAAAAFGRIAGLDQVMSDYRSTSELSALVAAAGQGPVPVSHDLYRVLELSQRLAELSDGAFDVTAAPQVRLWREARRTGVMPEAGALAAARARSGWRKLALDPESRTAELRMRGMALDLGGIAKGYAADHALLVLKQHGVARALVELGGEIVVGDPPPEADGWPIRVPGRPAPVLLSNAAISTSGDEAQHVVIDGTRYSHVVDPRTGIGLTDSTPVTVIAPSATVSDALATLVSVLGPDAGASLLRRHYPETRLLERQGRALGLSFRAEHPRSGCGVEEFRTSPGGKCRSFDSLRSLRMTGGADSLRLSLSDLILPLLNHDSPPAE